MGNNSAENGDNGTTVAKEGEAEHGSEERGAEHEADV